MSAPLAGFRVVECAETLGASYAGFLLSELGAEVIRVEAAAGARPSPGEHVLHRGKRSASLEPATLLGGADVLLHDDGAVASPADPDLIRCHLSGWGREGHPRGLPFDDALLGAATGMQVLQWSWAGSPVWLVTPMISYMAGVLAALGTTAALLARRRGAPAQTVEVSGLGAAFALNSGTYVTGPDHRGSLTQHGDPRGVYPTYGLYRAADGWLFVGALTQTFWVKLMTVLERVDLLAHPLLQANPLAFGTAPIRALVRGELEPMFAARTTEDWVRVLRAADIPCATVASRADLLSDPEARALGFVVPVDDPILGPTWQPTGPAEFSATPLPAPRPAVPPGADTAAVRAEASGWRRAPVSPPARTPRACLEGVRVIDLTSFIAGPFCPMLLADLGAEVVKVESADGDPFRIAAFGFAGWNRGKRSLVLDLKRPEGCDVLLDLARHADVVIDNLRPGVMDRLGVGWERLRAVNPRLVHTSITGYGSDGPMATLPGFDPVFQARCGQMQAQGGTEPVFHLVAYNDYCGGALGALATVAALLARERTGSGQRVDVSLFRTALMDQAAEMITYPGRPPSPVGARDYLGPSACRRLYACSDGWLCVSAATEPAAAALGRVAGTALGLDDAADGPGAAAIAAVLAGESRASALARLAAAGVPAAPDVTFEELFRDPYLRASGVFAAQSHPVLGELMVPGPFIHFTATPAVLGRAAPSLGADGPDVLAEIGYDAARIAALVAAGVVGAPT